MNGWMDGWTDSSVGRVMAKWFYWEIDKDII